MHGQWEGVSAGQCRNSGRGISCLCHLLQTSASARLILRAFLQGPTKQHDEIICFIFLQESAGFKLFMGYRWHSEVGRGGWDHGLASLGCGPRCQNEAKAAEVGDSANSRNGSISGLRISTPTFPSDVQGKKKKSEFAQSAWGGVRGQASLRDPGLLAVNSRSKPLRGWLWWILTVHRYCFYR